MKLYGRLPYVVVYILCLYGHKFVEPINSDYDRAPRSQNQRHRRDQYISPPADGYHSDTSDPNRCLISLDIKDKLTTNRIIYRRDDVKKTDTFIAKYPYIFYKIRRKDEILWKAEDEKYFPRVVIKESPTGQPFFRIYYTDEATESEIEYESPSDTAPRTIHKSVPGSPKPQAQPLPDDSVIPVINVDLRYKKSNQYITYEREDVKNREMFTTKGPYLIKKVIDGDEILWQSRNGMYAYRVIYKPDPVSPKLKVFFPEDEESMPEQPPERSRAKSPVPSRARSTEPLRARSPAPSRATSQESLHRKKAETSKHKLESDSDMDIRIITRSDLESASDTDSKRKQRRDGRRRRHSSSESEREAKPEPRVKQEPRLQHPPVPLPRLAPQARTAGGPSGGRHFEYQSSAEPIFEPTARPQRKPATEPSRVPRDPYEHYSEPEIKADSDQERRQPRHDPRSGPTPDTRPARPPQPARARDRPEEMYSDMPEPEFRPVPPSFVEPHVASGKKIPISVDIEFKFCTYLFDYHRHNNLGTYTPKEGFIFARIKRNDRFYCMGSDVIVWQTHDPKVYSTKVNVLGDTRVVIHLNDGRTLFYKRGFDSQWFRIDKSSYNPIDWNHLLIDLDLSSRRSTQYYEYFAYTNYMGRRKGTYLYVAREKFKFKSVFNNRTTIWAAYTDKECAYKVGVYRAIGGTEQMTVFLLNGKTRTFVRQLYGCGMGSDWYEDIIMPGHGGHDSYRPSSVGQTGQVPAHGRTGVSLNLPNFTGQIKKKLSKLYKYVDISKISNPFSSNSQDRFVKLEDFHTGDMGNVKQASSAPDGVSSRNRTFTFDDDDDDDENMAEYVDFNGI
ncbi:hypothetical protein MACJ_001265 [Theileria orientalis]|uniref:Uncharacterized protein n=1 Tax=Theileria orientalis TaxID=68886 RepID=A0A976M858_THEOR|nr:hypothetical protein MACJ_001265 [Theileria orientalis]